ncbi:MAG: class I tRNA ligase family protein, partial [Patescibacteria group bacterium]|nr:class I tRNA ligase family protein [Patescibacteria group bacterium]
NLKKLNWPNKVLLGQKNWIGESKGAEIIFKVEGKDIPIHVFTTRVDTSYGVTALVIAPDKKSKDGKTPLAIDLATSDNKTAVEQFINKSQIAGNKSQIHSVGSKTEEEKSGVFTGAYAINPFSEERIPIWVADYVVGWYGTGALMLVPAHDERDFEFAKKYNLNIKKVIKTDQDKLPTTDYGILINSGELSGLTTEEATSEMIAYLHDTEAGESKTQYKLRDWIISRQRYWGAPIPMIYCESCAEKGLSWFNSEEAKEANSESRIQDSELIENYKLKIKNSASEAVGWFPVKEEDLPVLLLLN